MTVNKIQCTVCTLPFTPTSRKRTCEKCIKRQLKRKKRKLNLKIKGFSLYRNSINIVMSWWVNIQELSTNDNHVYHVRNLGNLISKLVISYLVPTINSGGVLLIFIFNVHIVMECLNEISIYSERILISSIENEGLSNL